MKRLIMVGAAAILVVAAAESLLAHHSLARFDTTTAVRVNGVIAQFAWVNPHTVVYVDEKRADGKIQRWAAEGPGILQATRRGVDKDTFRVGDEIEICGYTLKDDTGATTSIARALATEDLVIWDGKTRAWGDYGHHKCHRGDDADIHPYAPLSLGSALLDFPKHP